MATLKKLLLILTLYHCFLTFYDFTTRLMGRVHIKNIHSYNGGTTDETPYVVNYENATWLPVYTTSYLPVDIPWESGNWTDAI